MDYETVGWEPSCGCYGEAVDAKNEADIKVYLAEHPEEEPVWKLLSEKVAIPCKVLDPFGGSGATGAAAKNLGRDSVIIELNPSYCELAEVRVKEGK